ncbi:MAG: AtpZ/AtpI family protein [Acidimicrobiales bacterium]|nr:AtpZ/AtpI family protein [Acidimicrobiales bacterium]
MAQSQRGELTKDFRRSSGSFELVMSPLLFALIGFGLDRWLGTVPVLTILFAVVGFAGAAVKLYYAYKFEMDRHEAEATWAKQS